MANNFHINDTLKKKEPNKNIMNFLEHCLDPKLLFLDAFIISSIFLIACLSFQLLFSSVSPGILLACVLAGPCVCSILLTYAVNHTYNLRGFGLKRNQKIWLIDFKAERVVPAEIVSLDYCDRKFNRSKFFCQAEGELYKVYGDDIFGSESVAKDVLKYVQTINNCAFSKYYPGWKTDNRFVTFLKRKFPDSLGFCRFLSTNETYVVADEVEINGQVYTPMFSVEKIFNEFFKYIGRQSLDDESPEELVRRIDAYRNPFTAK